MAGEAGVSWSSSITGGGVTLTGRKVLPINNPSTFKQIIPANSTNAQITKPDVTLANCQLMAIGASQDCTVTTNAASTGSPQETLALKKDAPLSWKTGDPSANKFLSGNVTDWYVTTGGTATLLTIIIAEDSSPTITEG